MRGLVTSRGHRILLIDCEQSGSSGLDDLAHAAWLGTSQESDAKSSIEVLQQLRPDWLVIDHYGIDHRWERLVRDSARRVMVIDDLADRTHDCDLLLDQNFYCDVETRYRGLVPDDCALLLGPQYALLRPEFSRARARCQPRRDGVGCVFVFLSSFDPQNYTGMVIDAIADLGYPEVSFDVVVGREHPYLERLQERAKEVGRCRFHSPAAAIAELMCRADLAIGAGGSTTLERCFLGLPTVAIDVARNQRAMLVDLASAGCVDYIGTGETIEPDDLRNATVNLMNDRVRRTRMSHLGWELVADGTATVVDCMEARLNVQA
jgi:UDP-2,4-diacetamido-2,4,6-trideoxy-beta-L-altropyranose hydrolase